MVAILSQGMFNLLVVLAVLIDLCLQSRLPVWLVRTVFGALFTVVALIYVLCLSVLFIRCSLSVLTRRLMQAGVAHTR